MTNNRQPVDLKLDYEQTNAYFRMLADIRFKLLAIVPTLAGLGIYLAGRIDARPSLALSIIGIIATAGIVLYDLRNTQIYDRTRFRLQKLEQLMGFFKVLDNENETLGGVHSEHPKVKHRFFGIRVKHDYGLAAIYGAALGTWTYIAFNSTLHLFLDNKSKIIIDLIPIAPAVLILFFTVAQFVRIDRINNMEFGQPSNDNGEEN